MKSVLLVFLGGGIGSALRYLIGIWLKNGTGFPSATFLVNMVGSFLIGVLMGWIIRNTNTSSSFALLLITGVCGGFTTFSAFALENYQFFKNGNFTMLSLYVGGSLIIGILLVGLGIWFSKML
ncbi:MAG: fluoride efflux transporter CrcB [Flavobacteriaceae bacterium]|nr:fluoride efflux transporter CrcB [Flavobacteriaceae bacterium]